MLGIEKHVDLRQQFLIAAVKKIYSCCLSKKEKVNRQTREPLLKGKAQSGNTKGGSITVPLTSCFTGLQIKTKIVSCYTADSKSVRLEVNGTVILPPLVFPGSVHVTYLY